MIDAIQLPSFRRAAASATTTNSGTLPAAAAAAAAAAWWPRSSSRRAPSRRLGAGCGPVSTGATAVGRQGWPGSRARAFPRPSSPAWMTESVPASFFSGMGVFFLNDDPAISFAPARARPRPPSPSGARIKKGAWRGGRWSIYYVCLEHLWLPTNQPGPVSRKPPRLLLLLLPFTRAPVTPLSHCSAPLFMCFNYTTQRKGRRHRKR